MTKEEFEKLLNDLDTPDSELRLNGGRIPDTARYGTWLRRHDPIAFTIAYNEENLNHAD